MQRLIVSAVRQSCAGQPTEAISAPETGLENAIPQSFNQVQIQRLATVTGH
jgi:hypothetical protein